MEEAKDPSTSSGGAGSKRGAVNFPLPSAPPLPLCLPLSPWAGMVPLPCPSSRQEQNTPYIYALKNLLYKADFLMLEFDVQLEKGMGHGLLGARVTGDWRQGTVLSW